MLNEKEFLKKYQITQDEFNKTGLKWVDLIKIHENYLKQQDDLEGTLMHLLKIIKDEITKTASIRYRVKDPEHLIAKIIRKSIEDSDRSINLENYLNEIQDIIGVRIAHNFKSEGLQLEKLLSESSIGKFIDHKLCFFRAGDHYDAKAWESIGFQIKEHEAGYRSQHYVVKLSIPVKNYTCFGEIQVRTVFEDAWGEIDHTIRYPNIKKDEIVDYFSSLLNRFSGVADELGEFMEMIKVKQNEIENANIIINEQNTTILQLKKEIKDNKIIGHNNYGLGVSPNTFAAIGKLTPFPQITPITLPNFSNLNPTFETLSELSQNISNITSNNSFLSGNFIQNSMNLNHSNIIGGSMNTSKIIPISNIKSSLE